jgi:M6 family metalloprotease-like protein
VTFYGSTKFQNKFDPLLDASCLSIDKPNRPLQKGKTDKKKPAGDPPLNVLCLLADTNDHRFSGSDSMRTAYRDGRFNEYQPNTDSYWKEASFANVSINLNMPDRLIHLGGAFDDYFNRSFVIASLQTSGLAATTFPLALPAGTTVTLQVHDTYDRDTDVPFTPPATINNLPQLQMLWSQAFNAITSMPPSWVTCAAAGGELQFNLDKLLVGEGSFIRVKSGTGLAALGLNGPVEAPGNGSPASLTGKAVPGGFPLTIAVNTSVTLEVRDQNYQTRRYQINPTAGMAVANPSALAALMLPALNSEFNWVESFNAGANQLGLRLVAARSGPHAAIRVVAGTGLKPLGLDGPTRVDGVITAGGSDTVRGDSATIISEALSVYVTNRAAELGISIDQAHQANLDQLVANELKGSDSYFVLFADALAGMPSNKRGQASHGPFNVSVPGAGGYTYTTQLHAALVLGEGSQPWQTYAHEFGHNLGCWDLYQEPDYDPHFDSTNSYLRAWSLMSNHLPGNHIEGWHKDGLGFVSAGTLRDVFAPPPATTEHHKYTLIPLEYPESDYSNFGDSEFPIAQLVKIHLSASHWVGVENREPGINHSHNLPDDVNGQWPPDPAGRPGGVLITDTVDPWYALNRSPVTVMNYSGSGGANGQARGLKAGDSLPLTSTYPKYDGITVNVVAEVPGPVGKPKAFKVDIVWGPGNFLDLGIRPWQAPQVYGTPDIWIDWPGNGIEDYPNTDPPVGNGDQPHWDPNGSVDNFVKVRVHNYGTILGKKVVVRAYHNEPIGMGDHGAFVPFPDSAPQDIPPGEYRNFQFDWRPTRTGHTCIRAEIFRHESDLSDLDPSNNAAQENVDDFWPTAGSPYQPADFTFSLKNDFKHEVEVEFRPSGLVDGMDLELERRYVKMLPEQRLQLRGRLLLDTAKIPPAPGERKQKYCFNLHAFKRTPDSLLPFGGVSFDVHPGFKSKLNFGGLDRGGEPQSVVVTGKLDGQFPGAQTVDAAIVAVDGKSYGGTGKTTAAGNFTIAVDGRAPRGPGRLMLYYFGPNLAASWLGPVPVNVP